MARKRRIEWENSLHHVMARGIDGRAVFDLTSERANLVKRFAYLVPELDISVYAWVIMPNHFHLLLRTPKQGNISKFMHRLLTGYAVVYNNETERNGHVFQGRYKSILVQEDEYFLKLVRYIHLNPLKAGIVRIPEELDSYIWSGHLDIIGMRNTSWMDSGYVLDYFTDSVSNPEENYRLALLDDINNSSSRELLHGSYIIGADGLQDPKGNDCQSQWKNGYRVLGDRNFALDVLSRLKEGGAVIRSRSDVHIEVDSIMERVSKEFNISIKAIRGRGRSPVLADVRALIAFAYSRELGLSQTDIARQLNMTQTGVSSAIKRGVDLSG